MEGGTAILHSGGFENVLNFRDVGKTINDLLGKTVLRQNLLFRSARPDRASSRDRELLTQKYGIKTVIDLRSKSEHLKQASKKQDAPNSPAATAQSIQLPGVRYFSIDLNGSAFSRAQLWQLSWANMARLFYLYSLGYRTDAISILGRNVMSPHGLAGLSYDTLRYSSKEVRAVFSILSDQSKYPILVHCAQGKDRTGLVLLLILALLKIDQSVISSDYQRSEAELTPEQEERMRELESLGLSEEFARCPKDFVENVQMFLDETYGGTEEYLKGVGVDEAMLERMRHILMMAEGDVDSSI